MAVYVPLAAWAKDVDWATVVRSCSRTLEIGTFEEMMGQDCGEWGRDWAAERGIGDRTGSCDSFAAGHLIEMILGRDAFGFLERSDGMMVLVYSSPPGDNSVTGIDCP